MKIAIFEVEPWECDSFKALTTGHDVSFTEKPLAAEDALNAQILSTFIYSDLSAQRLQPFKNLKMIATRSTGYDHIDLEYCKKQGIAVCNVPSYGENTVAEHVFALLLTISHNMTEAVERTRRGDFSQKGLQGFDLKGKTIGIIGTGHIGRHTARIAQGFEMDVLAYDEKPDAGTGLRYVGLEELLSRSDIVSLHVPGNSRTKDLISDAQFEKMKKGVVIINTARGNVLNVHALLKNLASGKVAAAGLDVLPEEPAIREEAELLRSFFADKHDLPTLLADHILLRMRNVFITPHSAFNTREAEQRILQTTAENISAFIAGKPQNLVTG